MSGDILLTRGLLGHCQKRKAETCHRPSKIIQPGCLNLPSLVQSSLALYMMSCYSVFLSSEHEISGQIPSRELCLQLRPWRKASFKSTWVIKQSESMTYHPQLSVSSHDVRGDPVAQSYCSWRTRAPCVVHREVEEECPKGDLCAAALLERHKAIYSHQFGRPCVVLPFQVWSIIEPLWVSNHQMLLEAKSIHLSGPDSALVRTLLGVTLCCTLVAIQVCWGMGTNKINVVMGAR